MNDYNNVLVYGLNFIGDSLFITPFLKNLRKFYSNAKITVLCGKKGAASILENNPNIDVLVSLANEKNKRIDFIKKGGYDAAFILNTSFKAAYEVYKARINVRVGHKKEMRGFLLTHTKRFDKSTHYAENHLRLFESFTGKKTQKSGLEIYPSKKDIKDAGLLLNSENKRVAILIPGTTNEKKSWPVHNFKLICSELKTRGFFVITVGTDKEKAYCADINPDMDLCGKTRLSVLYPLFSLSALIITGDTGPMHIASALNEETETPLIIALFGPTSPEIYGPYNYDKSVVLRHKTGIMSKISVNRVLSEVETEFS